MVIAPKYGNTVGKQCHKPPMTGNGKHTIPHIFMVMTAGCFFLTNMKNGIPQVIVLVNGGVIIKPSDLEQSLFSNNPNWLP